jgi:hypothetical protein
MKLDVPIEALAGPVALPGLFLRCIGVAEVAGALGLVVPSLLRIRPRLTPVAAAGLVVIMIGATVVTAIGGPAVLAVVPAVVGMLLGTVLYGRIAVAPISARATNRESLTGPQAVPANA